MSTDPRLARPLWRGRTNVDALTISCIEHAEQIMRDENPRIAHQFVVTQGSYQGSSGDPDSGTTHRLGGGVDLGWCGHQECYRALRRAGMFIWHRFPWQGEWPDHFHGAPIDHPYMDYRLAAQQDSYFARGNGLGGADDGPRLDPIPRPVWPYPPEDPMADYAAQLDRIEKTADQALQEQRAFRKGSAAAAKAARQKLSALLAEVRDDATRAQVAEVIAMLEDADE